MEKWILFVSPFESITDNWEVITFNSEKEVNGYIYNHDLTKEYYATTIEEMIDIIRCSKRWEER